MHTETARLIIATLKEIEKSVKEMRDSIGEGTTHSYRGGYQVACDSILALLEHKQHAWEQKTKE